MTIIKNTIFKYAKQPYLPNLTATHLCMCTLTTVVSASATQETRECSQRCARVIINSYLRRGWWQAKGSVSWRRALEVCNFIFLSVAVPLWRSAGRTAFNLVPLRITPAKNRRRASDRRLAALQQLDAVWRFASEVARLVYKIVHREFFFFVCLFR